MRASGPPAPQSLLEWLARPRAERRRRLATFGLGVVRRLRGLGLDVEGCDVQDGTVTFVPDGRLSLTLGPELVQVALELGPEDLDAVRAQLTDPGYGQELTTALSALPEQFLLGALPGSRSVPASRASSDDLRALLDRPTGLRVGWAVPAGLATAHAATLDGHLEDALVALGELLSFIAPCADDAAAPPGREARREDRPARVEEEREPRRPRARVRAREREREREPEREAEPAPAAEGEGTPLPARLPAPKPRLRAAIRARRSGVGVDKGARVRVLSGPFTGKVGHVQELDGKGGATVMLGLLAVRVDVKDLAAGEAEGGRPRLSSSHRKPVPVRS